MADDDDEIGTFATQAGPTAGDEDEEIEDADEYNHETSSSESDSATDAAAKRVASKSPEGPKSAKRARKIGTDSAWSASRPVVEVSRNEPRKQSRLQKTKALPLNLAAEASAIATRAPRRSAPAAQPAEVPTASTLRIAGPAEESDSQKASDDGKGKGKGKAKAKPKPKPKPKAKGKGKAREA